jgi:hypothetical protein
MTATGTAAAPLSSSMPGFAPIIMTSFQVVSTALNGVSIHGLIEMQLQRQ